MLDTLLLRNCKLKPQGDTTTQGREGLTSGTPTPPSAGGTRSRGTPPGAGGTGEGQPVRRQGGRFFTKLNRLPDDRAPWLCPETLKTAIHTETRTGALVALYL